MAEYNVIGTSLAKVDAPERVTGKAAYGADLDLPGMLWAKLVRSPHAHARIKYLAEPRRRRAPTMSKRERRNGSSSEEAHPHRLILG